MTVAINGGINEREEEWMGREEKQILWVLRDNSEGVTRPVVFDS